MKLLSNRTANHDLSTDGDGVEKGEVGFSQKSPACALGDRPSIHDVAARAKVSSATVSRLINGSARVSPTTARCIRQAMDELGYVPSRLAQSFARGSSRTIVLLVDADAQSLQNNSFLVTLTVGLNDVLADADYSVRVMSSRRTGKNLHDPQTWARSAWNRREFDGVVITNPAPNDVAIETMAQEGIPAVVVGRYPYAPGVIQVDVDNVGGTRLSTSHLINLGHEAIAFLRPAIAMTVVSDRLQGYAEALARIGVRASGDSVLKTEGEGSATFSFEAARFAVDRAVKGGWRWSALVAFNDEMALGAMQALQDHAMAVPSDVSVIGFDNLPYARMTRPALSTVHQDIRQLGQHAARAILSAIRGEPVADLTIQTVSFVERESTGPPSPAAVHGRVPRPGASTPTFRRKEAHSRESP